MILEIYPNTHSSVGYADSVGATVVVGLADGDPVGDMVGDSDGAGESVGGAVLQSLKASGRGTSVSSMIIPFAASYHFKTSGFSPRLQSPYWNFLVIISVKRLILGLTTYSHKVLMLSP